MKYFQFSKIPLVVLLLTLNVFLGDCRKTTGGSRRSSSGSRTYSRNVPTSKTPTNTYGGSNNNYYGTGQRKASNVATTPRYVVKTQPTVRHYPTQRTVHQQQSVYTQRPAYPQQASYPKQSYPQQNYPSNSHPTPRPSFGYGYGSGGYNTGNNYGGGIYRKKDHGVRNSVLAGLGGSALGMYLGYKLGSFTSGMHNPYNGGLGGGYGGYTPGPQYSVVHHYHHGDKPIIQNAVIEPNVITACNNVSMCTPNTTPLCMTNGTIYCVTPVDQTSTCTSTTSNLPCVNAMVSAPCLNETDGNCNSTELTTQNLEIPCVSSINVYGDFNTNPLTVHSEPSAAGAPSSLSNQGINNKYCVTVIAEPLVESDFKDLSNEEYVRYLQQNPTAKEEADVKVGNIMDSIGRFMLF